MKTKKGSSAVFLTDQPVEIIESLVLPIIESVT